MADKANRSVSRAVILAGGAGTRLKPLTDHTPKPLVEFGTKPFMLGVLRRLADVSVTDVWLLVGTDTAPFHQMVAAARALGVTVNMVSETVPLGTAGGVRQLAANWTEPFFVLNGDILTDVDFAAVARTHQHGSATLVVSPVDDPSAYGVCDVADGAVVGFIEKPSRDVCPGPALVNAGTYIVSPELFAGLPDGELSFERDVFPDAIRNGHRLNVHVSDANWADLGTPQRFLAGQRLVLDGAIRWPGVVQIAERTPGVRVADDATVAADVTMIPPVLLAAGVTVESGATVGPHVVLGPGVTVGENTTLRDTSVHAGARIGARTVLAGTIVGPHVVVGDDVAAHDDAVLVTDVVAATVVPTGFRG